MCLAALGNASNEVPGSAQYVNIRVSLSVWGVPMKASDSSQ